MADRGSQRWQGRMWQRFVCPILKWFIVKTRSLKTFCIHLLGAIPYTHQWWLWSFLCSSLRVSFVHHHWRSYKFVLLASWNFKTKSIKCDLAFLDNFVGVLATNWTNWPHVGFIVIMQTLSYVNDYNLFVFTVVVIFSPFIFTSIHTDHFLYTFLIIITIFITFFILIITVIIIYCFPPPRLHRFSSSSCFFFFLSLRSSLSVDITRLLRPLYTRPALVVPQLTFLGIQSVSKATRSLLFPSDSLLDFLNIANIKRKWEDIF